MTLLIGITQRVENVDAYRERRDCLDQKWISLFESLDVILLPIPNKLEDVAWYLEQFKFNGFILSGGNDIANIPGASNIAPERDVTETGLLTYATINELPILGVCRGMQMMNSYCGGELVKVNNHVGSRHNIVSAEGVDLVPDKNEVNSFHGWGIMESGLADQLYPIAYAEHDGSVEGIANRELPWVGIMWHPEREEPASESDLKLIKDLFGLNI